MPIPNKVLGQNTNTTTTCNDQPFGWSRFQSYKRARKPRTFSVSYQLALDSAPTLFESKLLEEKTYVRDVPTVHGMQPFFDYCHTRVWIEVETGTVELFDKFLKKYNWKWTGHFNTYIGHDYKPKKKKAA